MTMESALESIAALVSPIEDNHDQDASNRCDLESILKAKLTIILGESKEESLSDVPWTYVSMGLAKLTALKKALSSLDDEKSALLSVKQQKQVTSLLEIISVFGLLPNLIPGVVAPAELRSNVLENFKLETGAKEVSIEEKYRRLCLVTDSLLKLTNDKHLGSIVLTKLLADLMTSLIQLSFAPLKKPDPDSEESSSDFVMTEEKYQRFVSDQAKYQNELEKLMNRVYPPLVVRNLLMIQGGRDASNRRPKWMQKVCGQLLSSRLAKENGVLHVIRGILDVGGIKDEEGKDVMQTEKIQMIAEVLSNPSYSSYNDAEAYYEKICPQILDMLRIEDKSDSDAPTYHMIACASVKTMTEKSLIFSRRYLLDIIMAPLLNLTESPQNVNPDASVTETDIDECISVLHKLFVAGNEPSGVWLYNLEPVVLILLKLHCSITFGVSHLKSNVEQLLQRYLKCSGTDDALLALKCFAFEEKPDTNCRLRVPLKDLKFFNGDNGGVVPVVSSDCTDPMFANFYVADDETSIALVDLVQVDKELAAEFFMELLKELSEIMAPEGKEEEIKRSKDLSIEEKLMECQEELDNTMARLRRRLMVIRLLGLFSEDEKIQKSIMKDTERLFGFLSLTVQRSAKLALQRREKQVKETIEDEDDEENNTMLEAQSLNTALTLMAVKMSDSKMSASDWQKLQHLVEDFKIIEFYYHDKEARKTARRLKQLIATHGVILGHKADMEAACKGISDKTEKIRNLTKQTNEMKIAQDASNEQTEPLSYSKALSDLTDPLLPVRGHGLIALTKLVEKNDEDTMKNVQKVIRIFKDSLEDEDTFVYLQAINGLVACGNVDTSPVLDILTREFSLMSDRKSDSVETRTKIGEALVKLTRNLGEMTPSFKNELLNPFLHQLNHPDSLVRASSLSNLGEVCKNLSFSLGGIVEEIFSSLDNCIKFDKSIEVRRAAVMVITLLLQGLGENTFKVLHGKIKDIWRSLLDLSRRESDEALLTHAFMAIEEIDKITKNFLIPDPNNLTKKIYVLDPPPQD